MDPARAGNRLLRMGVPNPSDLPCPVERVGEPASPRLVRDRVALAVVVVVSAVLRLYALGRDPVALNQDEAVSGYDAYSLATTLRDHHGHFLPILFQSFGDWVSPLLTYLTVPFVELFGLSEWAIRLPGALLGIATVPLLYVLAGKLCRRKDVALLAAAILATAPWSVTLSRWAIPPTVVPFAVILFVLALLWTAERSDGRHVAGYGRAALTAVVAAALTYAYPTQKLFVPMMIGTAVLVFFRRERMTAAVLVIVYVALVTPIFALTLTDPTKYNARFEEVSLQGSWWHMIIGFVLRYALYLSPISLFGSGDANVRNHVPGFGSNFAFLAAFFYIGAFLTILTAWRERSRHAVFLLIWLALFPVAGSLTTGFMHVLRSVHGLPLVPIFAAMGVVGLSQALPSATLRRALYATVVVLTFFAALDFATYYLTEYRNVSKAAYQYGLRDVVTYVLWHEPRFRSIIVDDSIAAPYIYVLFFAKRDPRTLDYQEINADPDGKVRRLGKFRFEPVGDKRITGARLIYRVIDAGSTWYSVYETRDRTCLVQRASHVSSDRGDAHLPALLKPLLKRGL